MPWSQLIDLIPEDAVAPLLLNSSTEITRWYELAQSNGQALSSQWDFNWLWLVPLPGLIWLARLFIQQIFIQKRWLNEGQDCSDLLQQQAFRKLAQNKVSIRSVKGLGNAYSSGIIHAKIWIDASLAKQDIAHSIILHELTHIQRHDNAKVLLLNLLHALHWWNPLAYFFKAQALHDMELACDEACKARSPNYLTHLAEAMLNSTRPLSAPLATAFFSHGNISRLKRLQEEHLMKMKHWLSLITILAFGVSASWFALAGDTEAEDQALTRLELSFEDEQGSYGQSEFEIVDAEEIMTQLRAAAQQNGSEVTETNANPTFDHEFHIRAPNQSSYNELSAIVERSFGKHSFEDLMHSTDIPLDSLVLKIRYSLNGEEELSSTLLTSDNNWVGLRSDSAQIRVNPVVRGDRIYLTTDVQVNNGEKLIWTLAPEFITVFGEEASFVSTTEVEGQQHSLAMSFLVEKLDGPSPL
jgi:beta-lactamase regulating signal transducer with metallopeptidase domain